MTAAPGEASTRHVMTPGQEQLWIVEDLDWLHGSYGEDLGFYLRGELDVDRYLAAWCRAAKRYPELSAVVAPPRDDSVPEIIPGSCGPEIHTVDFSGDDAAEQRAIAWATELAELPYDLQQGPLLRVAVATIASHYRLLVIAHHHLIADMMSLGRVLAEIAADYLGEPIRSEWQRAPSYPEFARWLDGQLASGAFDEAITAAADRLCTQPTLDLPTDLSRPASRSGHGITLTHRLSDPVRAALQQSGQRLSASQAQVWNAAWAGCLSEVSGLSRYTLALGCDGRSEGFEHTVGFFACTVPMAVDARGESFRRLVADFREAAALAWEHQLVPLADVLALANVPRDPARTPLMQVVLNTTPGSSELAGLVGVHAQRRPLPRTRARYDLIVNGELDEGLVLIEYDSALFTEETVRRLLDAVEQLVVSGVGDGDLHWRELVAAAVPHPPVPPAERRTAVSDGVAPENQAVARLVAKTIAETLDIPVPAGSDDFFAIGGHSVGASSLIRSLNTQLQVDLPLRALFENPVVDHFATEIALRHPEVPEALAALEALDEAELRDLGFVEEPAGPMPEAPVEANMLTVSEEQFLLADALNPGSPVSNLTLAFDVRGDLATARLRTALQTIVDRHEPLRSAYRLSTDGCPEREVLTGVLASVDEHDLTGSSAEDIQRLEQALACRPFSLSEPPLLRTDVLRTGEGRWRLLIGLHHIVMDHWSLVHVLLPELDLAYRGEATKLPPPSSHLAAAARQRQQLTSSSYQRHREYWSDTLSGMAPLELPTDKTRPERTDPHGRHHQIAVPAPLVAQARAAAASERTTFFALCAAVLGRVLHDWTGASDVQFLTPAENRDEIEADEVCGCFVNMLVIRHVYTATEGLALSAYRGAVLEAREHQRVPVGDALHAIGMESHLSSGRGAYVTLNVPEQRLGLRLDGCKVGPAEVVPHDATGCDLEFSLLCEGDPVLDIKYRTSLWHPETIAELGERFLSTVEAACRPATFSTSGHE